MGPFYIITIAGGCSRILHSIQFLNHWILSLSLSLPPYLICIDVSHRHIIINIAQMFELIFVVFVAATSQKQTTNEGMYAYITKYSLTILYLFIQQKRLFICSIRDVNGRTIAVKYQNSYEFVMWRPHWHEQSEPSMLSMKIHSLESPSNTLQKLCIKWRERDKKHDSFTKINSNIREWGKNTNRLEWMNVCARLRWLQSLIQNSKKIPTTYEGVSFNCRSVNIRMLGAQYSLFVQCGWWKLVNITELPTKSQFLRNSFKLMCWIECIKSSRAANIHSVHE